jgi:glucan phosphoethanolaminetransferase (alkaline phosphatase superfamily)
LEKTLPEAFQEAGFQTVWLSNQSRILSFERILSTADIRYETGKDMSVTNNYDEYLLAPLQNAFKSGMKKQFIVVHTMGSHWRYDTRYPNSFEQYTPSLGKDFTWSMITPANRQQLLNAYDNTILYTDYFLDSLLTTVENQHIPALVLYTSDHGENLYDDERNLVLHGNYSASKWLFHVPFIVWYSDEYAQLYPNKIAQLYTHKDIRDNSSVIFHSMMDAAGLQYNNNTAGNAEMHTRSIFSNEYCMPDTLYVLTAEEECIALEE